MEWWEGQRRHLCDKDVVACAHKQRSGGAAVVPHKKIPHQNIISEKKLCLTKVRLLQSVGSHRSLACLGDGRRDESAKDFVEGSRMRDSAARAASNGLPVACKSRRVGICERGGKTAQQTALPGRHPRSKFKTSHNIRAGSKIVLLGSDGFQRRI